MSTQDRIKNIPGWTGSRFLRSLHQQCMTRTLSAKQFEALSKIEREHGIEFKMFGEPKFTFLDQTMKGWTRTWKIIEAKYGDLDTEDSETHEVWQYLGTVDNKVHEFRHRSLNGKRVFEKVAAEATDFERMVG